MCPMHAYVEWPFSFFVSFRWFDSHMIFIDIRAIKVITHIISHILDCVVFEFLLLGWFVWMSSGSYFVWAGINWSIYICIYCFHHIHSSSIRNSPLILFFFAFWQLTVVIVMTRNKRFSVLYEGYEILSKFLRYFCTVKIFNHFTLNRFNFFVRVCNRI